jgi:hypothetical protein
MGGYTGAGSGQRRQIPSRSKEWTSNIRGAVENGAFLRGPCREVISKGQG